MKGWKNCPCGTAPTITETKENDVEYGHFEASCEKCKVITLTAETVKELQKVWNKKVDFFWDMP